jgi:regulation of enolase protein 1 (concanavalin A-like superfamily)
MRVPGIPTELAELHGPVSAIVDGGRLAIASGPGTDLFAPPSGSAPTVNAPALIGTTAGDFLLAATVTAELRATFDAGALLLWRDPETWAKLALERSPEGRPTVVSVVTRGRSDDCNSVALGTGAARLRAARLGEACAFHVELAGRWELVRHFTLGAGPLSAGFLAQSPTGPGCSAAFAGILLEERLLADVRDGS